MIIIPNSTALRTRGSALLTTMILTGILTVSLAGYIAVVSQQNKFSARAQGWNLAIAVAEAGLEEGLQHLNANSAKLSVDGWKYDGGAYTITRRFGDGNGYRVHITNSTTPIVVSRAYINNFTFAPDQKKDVGTVGGEIDPTKTIVRAVAVTCSKGSLFTRALAIQKSLDLNGNNVLTDSYDSSSLFGSSNGIYSAALSSDSGDIACNGTLKNAVDIGNANIYGRLATGPDVQITIGKNGAIGSKEWQKATGGKGIQDGWVTDDSNFTFPDTSLPYNTGLPVTSGNVVTTTSTTSSTAKSSSTYPSPTPSGGVVTNITTASSSFYPSPPPKGITTNTTFATGSLPTPVPVGTVTNTIDTSSSIYPTIGTYLGSVKFQFIAVKPYFTFLYKSIVNYTYPVHTYNYPVYSYSYDVVATNTVYTTNYYDNILYSGDYLAKTLKGSTLIAGKARLVLTDGLEMSSKDSIIMGSGGKIEMYVDGESMSITGKGVANQTGKPADFMVYCTPNVTDIKIAGNATFVGVLVAPNADLVLNGGGKDDQDFCGAAMVSTLKMNGGFKFHYDKALAGIGGNGRYLITSWNEIP